MKRVLAIVLSLLLVFSMIACSNQSDTAQNAGTQGSSNAAGSSSNAGNADPWNVAVFTMSGSGEFWASVMAGAERACEEFGLVYTIDGPATETSYEQQIAMVEDAITKGADAICIAVCDSEALVPTLEAAAAKGIKIILFNTTCNYDGLTFIATDNYEAGRLGGKALGEALGGEGKVCLLGSQETVPSNVARCEGARDYIEENFPNMEVVDIQYCDGDMEKALTISNDWITAIPDLAGIFSNNDFSTIAAANIIEERGRVGEIVHVGFDATETYYSPEDIDEQLIDACRVFLLSTVSQYKEPCRLAAAKIVEMVKERGKLLVYDPNWNIAFSNDKEFERTVMLDTMHKADIVKISVEEAEFLFGKDITYEAVAHKIRSFGAKFVTITLGPRGCYYSYKGGEGHLPTYDVKVADTTGSGDAFIGGFIYQLTRLNMPVIEQIPQPDIERMLRFAHACGALCASRKGAMPSVENEAEVERCMQEVPILLFD